MTPGRATSSDGRSGPTSYSSSPSAQPAREIVRTATTTDDDHVLSSVPSCRFIALSLDLEFPRLGLIRIDVADQLLVRLLSTMT
jgi:hypothetical protein